MTASLGLHDLWLFAAAVALCNLTPGPDLLFTLARTLHHGVRAGTAAALGIASGCVVHALGAAFGLAASAEAFTLVKWAGAAYLVWLAVGMLRAEPGAATAQVDDVDVNADVDAAARGESVSVPRLAAAAAPDLGRIYRQGLLTNALNPKVALFFLAFLPQFIDAASAHKTWAFLALGAWFVVQGGLFLVAFAFLVAPLGRWQAPRRVRRALRAGGAALFLALAARLALSPSR